MSLFCAVLAWHTLWEVHDPSLVRLTVMRSISKLGNPSLVSLDTEDFVDALTSNSWQQPRGLTSIPTALWPNTQDGILNGALKTLRLRGHRLGRLLSTRTAKSLPHRSQEYRPAYAFAWKARKTCQFRHRARNFPSRLRWLSPGSARKDSQGL